MKMWKKLMVFAVSILLISAILAAQYVSVQVDSIVIDIDTQFAGLQIGAGDSSISSSGLGDLDHDYTLEYVEGTGFQLNFGIWGEHNAFTSTAAFFIANAVPEDVYITGFEAFNSTGDPVSLITYGITMYLHNDEHAAELGSDYINVNDMSTVNYVHLVGVTDAYGDAGNLTITGAVTNATWQESSAGGDSLWWLDSAEELAAGLGEAGTGSAVWVRISISPATPMTDFGELVIRFNTQSEI